MPLCSLTECMLQLKLADNKYLSHIMVNVLKFRTLYSILFWPKFSFLCSCFLNYLVERQTVLIAPSGAVWSGSALFAYVILSYTLVFKILANLLYYKNIINFVYLTMLFERILFFFTYLFLKHLVEWPAVQNLNRPLPSLHMRINQEIWCIRSGSMALSTIFPEKSAIEKWKGAIPLKLFQVRQEPSCKIQWELLRANLIRAHHPTTYKLV